MASLTTHQSAETTKLLLLGDSGSGKTGSLAALAAAGYNLRILDLDNGLDVLANLLSDPTSPYPKGSLDRVKFITVTEKMRMVGNKPVPASASVWTRCMNILSKWEDGEEKLGPVTSWTPNDVLVIDSLSFLGIAAMNHILALNGRLGNTPFQNDWGVAQGLLESLLQLLFSTEVKCNVVMCCHITMIGEEGQPQKGYPNSLGRSLPKRVGQYFNSALMVTSRGSGAALKRSILTTTNGMIELKNSSPLKVKPEYPLQTGLADYFLALRGKHPI